MMDKPKIYLETTMFSFYYGQETTPEYRQYKSEVRAVFDSLRRVHTPAPWGGTKGMDSESNTLREQHTAWLCRAVVDLIKAREYEPYTSLYAIGEINDESNQEKRINMRNLITDYAWTDERVRRVNVREGYQGIGIYKPAEVLEL
jgi:hypothetical protein